MNWLGIYHIFLNYKISNKEKESPIQQLKAIDLLTKEIIREQWHLLGYVELIGEDIRMIAPVDIKSQLANFLIDRNKGQLMFNVSITKLIFIELTSNSTILSTI